VNTLYTGPVARALGGVDLALPVGMTVAACVYALMMRTSDNVLAARGRAV
jgi:purine-cytosine permease-like protein